MTAPGAWKGSWGACLDRHRKEVRASLSGWVTLGQSLNHSGPVCLEKNGDPSLVKAVQRCGQGAALPSSPLVTLGSHLAQLQTCYPPPPTCHCSLSGSSVQGNSSGKNT